MVEWNERKSLPSAVLALISPIPCPGLFLKQMISTATSAVTWRSLRTNSNPRSKDGGKSGVERMPMWRQRLLSRLLLMTTVNSIWEFMLTLLTYPMSTCTAERSFSSMKRLKTPLRSFVWAFSISTMTDGRLRSIAILHIHKHKDVDIDVITEFARLNKGRRLGLCL